MKKYSELSKGTQQKLLTEFCEALLNLNKLDEAVKFLTDLLTRSEALMLAKRIKIAKLLIEGKDYKNIEQLLRVSHVTIAKVAGWLDEAGDGFRLVAQRSKKKRPQPKGAQELRIREWKAIKRRYPIAFWPQLLVEEIVKAANNKQKEKIRQALNKLDRKSKVYKQVSKMIGKI